ncbi:periplasmic heavy metal sensor [Pseudoruegeria sp. HB172150]|uniref:periplasmic heavy metal sensor n=1 Tax=Pseudoruegeria sp. HB172150 TaxID=2721164 RepID=UPI0015532DB4|nr:periplasmic heavy metal sensor [Pseudoruegeria sp. HB172150]
MSDPVTEPKRRFRWGRLVLILSLALNLLVVGLIAGALIKGPPKRDHGLPMRDLGFGPFVAALPDGDRQALAEAIREQEGSFQSRRSELRRQFDAFLAALRAEPYDHQALVQIIESQQNEIAESLQAGRDLLLDQIAGMDDGERAAYAESLESGLRRWKPDRPPPPKKD